MSVNKTTSEKPYLKWAHNGAKVGYAGVGLTNVLYVWQMAKGERASAKIDKLIPKLGGASVTVLLTSAMACFALAHSKGPWIRPR